MSQIERVTQAPVAIPDDGMKEFLIVLRRALLLIVGYIETRYQLGERRKQ